MPFHSAPPRAPMLNLAVVINDEIVRCGLGAMLRDLDMVHDVAEYRTAADLTEPSILDKLDVLVLRCCAREAESSLAGTAARRGVKVLVVLDSSGPWELTRAAEITAHGFVRQQGLTAGVLGELLLRLTEDQVFMPRELAQELFARAGCPVAQVAGDDGPDRRARAAALTSREQEALSLLAHGLVNKQIARQLRISEHGAKRLVASVLAKLSCPNRTLAVATALREGLIEAPAAPGPVRQ